MKALQGNIFAEKLLQLLEAQGKTLSDLERDAGIAREEIRRLRLSRILYGKFPVLNLDAMERIEQFYHLSNDDMRILRAALLVAAIQNRLNKRITSEPALAVAEEIQPIMEQVLRLPRSSAIRHDDEADIVEYPLDHILADAFDLLERADGDLRASHDPYQTEESVRYARLAWYAYWIALHRFLEYQPGADEQQACQYWRDYAQAGFSRAEQQLKDLGAPLPTLPRRNG